MGKMILGEGKNLREKPLSQGAELAQGWRKSNLS
jgi:hypothetical protein